ncbi:MAG: BglG family transcription antiterminator [Mycoplasmatales bacterium]
MLNDREIEIIKYVLIEKNIEAKTLEEKLQVSSRTIRYSFQNIRYFLENYQIKLPYSKKIGYFFEEIDRPKVYKIINELSQLNLAPKSQKQRCYFILGRILMDKRTDDYELSTILYTSSSTIRQDKKEIIKILSKNSINVDLQKLNFINKLNIFFNLASEETKLRSRLNTPNLRFLLADNFDELLLDNFRYELFNEYNLKDIPFSDFSLNLATYLCYFTYISKKDELSNTINNECKKHKIYYFFKKRNILLAKSEVEFLEHLLFSIGLYTNLLSQNKQNLKKLQIFFEKYTINSYFKIDFKTSEFQVFLNHIAALNHRLENNIQLKNELYEEIKLRFPFSFYLAVKLISYLFSKQDVVNNSEIALIALYIENILFTKSKILKVLIISKEGYAINNMLKKLINNRFAGRLVVSKVCSKSSSHAYLEANYQNIDFIIANTNIDYSFNLKVINTNPIFDEKDYQNIDKVILSKQYNSEYLYQIFEQQFLKIYHEKITFEQIISDVGDQFKQEKIIDDNQEFTNNILTRETKYSTYFGNGIMVPHPIGTYAKESKVFLVISKNKIKVNNYTTNIFFVMALSQKLDENIVLVYELILKVVKDKHLQEELLNCKKETEVLEILVKLINVL